MSKASRLTLRRYLIFSLWDRGLGVYRAAEVVAGTAQIHPEWDMDGEERTLKQWDRWARKNKVLV